MKTGHASSMRCAGAETVNAEAMRLFHGALSPAAERAAIEVLRSGQIASGPKVAEFEEALASLLKRPHVVSCNDMSSALVLALHLAGVGPGDEVLTQAFSCLSSNSPIARVGATAVWVDMDPATASMSVEDLRRAITPRCKALMLYHVAGYPGPTREITELCRQHGIVVIEDCNNAMGAVQDGRPVGSLGDYAVHSFYPNRQLAAIEGGALVCPDQETAHRARRLRRFGIEMTSFRDALGEINPDSDVPELGWSASFSQLNAAVGLAHMPELAMHLRGTRANAELLQDSIEGLKGIRAVSAQPGAEPAYWGCLILAERRDEILRRLKAEGIHASRLHQRNDRYSGFAASRRALPGTDALMNQVLALPCGWWLGEADMNRLVSGLSLAIKA